jgi:hypothetical protein
MIGCVGIEFVLENIPGVRRCGFCWLTPTLCGSYTHALAISACLPACKDPFLCRPYDWPVIYGNATTGGAAAATTAALWVGGARLAGGGSTTTTTISDTNSSYNHQHCFDGAFSIMSILGTVLCMAYWVYAMVQIARGGKSW